MTLVLRVVGLCDIDDMCGGGGESEPSVYGCVVVCFFG